MEFRTIVFPDKNSGIIDHRMGILTLGSCFADNIAAKLEEDSFVVVQNPFGTLYNPASICGCALRLASLNEFSEHDFFFHDQLWCSWDCHTHLAFSDKSEGIDVLNGILTRTHKFLKSSNTVILTLGTSFVFELNDAHKIVANCHKMPSKLFTRRRLDVEESLHYLLQIVDSLRSINPDLQFIVTVSPIRHAADGYHGNFLSKAILALSLERLAALRPNISYFPAFEIMMDDLRDYRFYDDDMKHPSSRAIDYIYMRFKEAFFNDRTVRLADEGRKIFLRKNHRFSDNTSSDVIESFNAETRRLQRLWTSKLSR